MILHHGHWYRVHTTKGGTFDRVRFDAPRLAFVFGGVFRQGEPRTISCSHVLDVADVGGVRFTAIEDCTTDVERAA